MGIDNLNMKPLLGAIIQQALRLAIIDCCGIVKDGTGERLATDSEREGWLANIHSLSQELWNDIDPTALGQNLGCRLLGRGGWEMNGVYAGNASPATLFNQVFSKATKGQVDDIIADLKEGGFNAGELPR